MLHITTLVLCIFICPFQCQQFEVTADHPALSYIPRTKFNCQERPVGYYADPDPATRCQVYHMCDMKGKKFSYLCPNGTLFHQQHLVCAHWYQVNCTKTAELYKVNEKMFPYGNAEANGQDDSLNKQKLLTTANKETVKPRVFYSAIRGTENEQKNVARASRDKFSSQVQNYDSVKSPRQQETSVFGTVEEETKSVTSSPPARSLSRQIQSFGFGVPNRPQTVIIDTPSKELQNYETFAFGTRSVIASTGSPERDTTTQPFGSTSHQNFVTSSPLLRTPTVHQSRILQTTSQLFHQQNSWTTTSPLGPLPPGSDEFGVPLESLALPTHSPLNSFPEFGSSISAETPLTTSEIPFGNQLLAKSTETHFGKLIETETPVIKHKLTMKFHEGGYFRKLGTLPINEKCPLCNPYFLKKGECFPCVTIR